MRLVRRRAAALHSPLRRARRVRSCSFAHALALALALLRLLLRRACRAVAVLGVCREYVPRRASPLPLPRVAAAVAAAAPGATAAARAPSPSSTAAAPPRCTPCCATPAACDLPLVCFPAGGEHGAAGPRLAARPGAAALRTDCAGVTPAASQTCNVLGGEVKS